MKTFLTSNLESMTIIFSYRTRDEIQDVRQRRDPITGFKERLISSGLATAEEIKVFRLIY